MSKAANDAKRQQCKVCKATDIRFDAKHLGYVILFTQGTSKYEKRLRCVGCFWHDPLEFRNYLTVINQKTHNIIMIRINKATVVELMAKKYFDF